MIAAAALAAAAGMAVAFIAGLANLVSLVLLVADLVCYAATGMFLSGYLRSAGWDTAAEILDGVSVGCDIVSVLLPLMSIAKSVAQIGAKAFCRAAVAAVKKAFKDIVSQVFRSSLRNGIRNAGRILFRTFIFDIDDFTKVVNGKRVLNLREPKLIQGEVTMHGRVRGTAYTPLTVYRRAGDSILRASP